MKRILGIVAILLLASGYAAAADYWHFGVGVRVAGVIPGKDYENALGKGILITFGNPDSRFTTQMDLDSWGVTYTKAGDLVETSPAATPDSLKTYKLRNYEYTGLGAGFLEKYRALDFSTKLSSYVIAGIGGYFLDRKHEESDNGTITMRTTGMHSLFQIAGGVGFEGRLNGHISGFIEGRYVKIVSGDNLDNDLMKGYFGVRYIF